MVVTILCRVQSLIWYQGFIQSTYVPTTEVYLFRFREAPIWAGTINYNHLVSVNF